jgi:hypothetical protein
VCIRGKLTKLLKLCIPHPPDTFVGRNVKVIDGMGSAMAYQTHRNDPGTAIFGHILNEFPSTDLFRAHYPSSFRKS